MVSSKLAVILALSTSFLFLAAVSPIFLFESLSEWYGSDQKFMFSTICHQQLDRTLHINRIPAAVCSRCTGIYAFLSIGFIIVPFIKRFFINNFRYSKAMLILAVMVLVIDYGMQWVGIYEGTNFIRFVTGSAVGISTTIFINYQK
ncbi:MAG: DUF2085 domain-containing protein [Balneolales bacterium]